MDITIHTRSVSIDQSGGYLRVELDPVDCGAIFDQFSTEDLIDYAGGKSTVLDAIGKDAVLAYFDLDECPK